MRLYSVFDKKAGTYSCPLPSVCDATMLREVSLMLQDPHCPMAQFPSDYELYFVGTYDDQVGILTQDTKPLYLVRLSDLIENPDDRCDD